MWGQSDLGSATPVYIYEDLGHTFTMGLTHVHLWSKETVNNEEAIESSWVSHGRLCSLLLIEADACGLHVWVRETEMQTEDEKPVRNSHSWQGEVNYFQEQQLLLSIVRASGMEDVHVWRSDTIGQIYNDSSFSDGDSSL